MFATVSTRVMSLFKSAVVDFAVAHISAISTVVLEVVALTEKSVVSVITDCFSSTISSLITFSSKAAAYYDMAT